MPAQNEAHYTHSAECRIDHILHLADAQEKPSLVIFWREMVADVALDRHNHADGRADVNILCPSGIQCHTRIYGIRFHHPDFNINAVSFEPYGRNSSYLRAS